MKNFMMVIFVCCLCTSANQLFAQIRKIPATITQAFKDKFPYADNVAWKDKLTGFEASFVVNDVNYQTTFSNNGDWKMTQTSIEETELPQQVQDGYALSKYRSWEAKSVYLIETPDSQKFMIIVQKSALQKKRLYFSYDGQLIKDPITL